MECTLTFLFKLDRKTIGPDTVIIFLGLEIDTNLMAIRIPKEKIEEAKDKLNHGLTYKKSSLKYYFY